MVKKITLIFAILLHLQQAEAQLQWPSVTSTSKPWTRWWWEGSAVNKKDLTWNLEKYKAAGLGGVEITPIYGVQGYEKAFVDFLSTQWVQLLKHALTESRRLGLGVDLANGTGWPFGGPWVTEGNASKAVFYKTYTLKGGEQLNDPIEYNTEAFVRTANSKPAVIDTIRQPVWTNKNLQALALDQIVYPGKLPLQALIAYSDNGTALDLTGKVDPYGKLAWSAPAGQWTLYALFMGLHGKMVERAAPGGEGYAIDHFSATAAHDYFKRFDQAFKGHDLSYLRALFNDSYEVDDARGQANWTPLLFQEFKNRRGYDLKEHLPALFSKDSPEKNSRVLYDYRATIDELLLEHFTKTWKKWGAGKGALLRNQSHGSPANTLDLYSAVDIPETEGTNILRFKFATSAANVTGKKLVSSESATWLNEHFLSSWGDVKKIVDLFFLGGVNHIFYHGTEYSPKDAPWPGWLFYAAVHFQPSNPQWKDFAALNTYVTRVQSFLQQGRPDNDVLLYYPIIDRYSEPGKELLQHFDGMERNFEGTHFEHVSQWMLDNGYGFDFFSDRQLQGVSYSGIKLKTGGAEYRTIVLPANKFISEKSLEKLVALAKAGAQVLVYKQMPGDVPGWGALESRRRQYQRLTGELTFQVQGALRKASVGKGAFWIGDDLDALLKVANARKESLSEAGLSYVRRKNTDGYTYFVNNRSAKGVEAWIPLQTKAASVALFDPMTGKMGLARWRNRADSTMEVLLPLKSFEAIIVRTYNAKKSGPPFPYIRAIQPPKEITNNWTLEFLEGGPVLPAKEPNAKLGSWTEGQEEEVKNFSGVARYSTSFPKPSAKADAWLLDLGKVAETAEVFFNGKKLATLVGPDYSVLVPSSLLKETNKLEVVVANLMANRIAYMDRHALPWKIFYNTNMPARLKENVRNGLFDASSWKPLPSGLLGPITLTAVSYE